MAKEDTTRKEHIAWCKVRALRLCDQGEVVEAWSSFVSDMNKHSETRGHDSIRWGTELLAAGHHKEPAAMRRFIEGFN